MRYVTENYLVKRLECGINTKILLFSHNSLWHYLQQFIGKYENFKIDVFGSRVGYMKIHNEYVLDDCDFIIFDSLDYYDEDELNELKDIALKVSDDTNKRVSIGYSYIVPMEERKNKDISEEIKIISFSDCDEYEETIFRMSESTILDLTELVVITHDELENQKVNRKMYQHVAEK